MAIKIVGSTIIDDSRNIVNAGVVTATSVSIGNSQVVSSGRQLQNILSLDNVTTDTIQKISGVRVAKDGTIVGFANTVNFSGVGLEVSPVVSGLSTVTVNGFPQVTNLLYVTKNGSDANDGRTLGKAKATIKGAVAAATEGTVIKVSAGTYIEDNPITLPNQVSVVGDSLREVSVTPQNQGDLFYVGEGNYIAEMAFVGPANPGAIFSFDPAAARYNAQSPYIQNCTNFIPDSIGLRIDGKLSIGPTKSMVLDSYTQYNQGGIGCSITNEGYAQLVSLFTICNETAVYCGSGGACDLTNSNSSFGDYALVSDGVGPLKFTGLIVQATDSNSDTFTIDLSTPTLGVVTAKYDNGCGIVTITTSQPHKFNVGMGVSIVGLGFTCPSGPGILTYPSGKFGYNFEVKTVAPGRYVDAANQIRANRTEIQDKSLAAIAIEHPDFYFPGDQQTTQYSRFYDSYRLIQQNKQEIVDKSLVSIAIGFPSGFYFPDEPETNARSRYYDASRLIQINKQEIVDKSLGAVAIAHSDFYFPGDLQTNDRSRYFDAYRLIQRNKDVIVSIAWTNAYNVYPAIASSESKCKRDLGYFVDAISADVFTGGNNYSRQFTLQYFDGAGNPITNGLQGEEVASNYAFVEARELMKSAITNTLVGAAYSDLTITADPVTGFNTDPSSCANVRTNIDNLVGIVTTVIGSGSTSSLPNSNFGYFNLGVGIGTTSSPGGYKCARDLGYLIDAISTDVFTGGNKYSRDFTLQYFDNTGNPISNGLIGEEVESVTAFNSARDLMKKAVTNQLNFKNLGISSGPATYGGIGTSLLVLQSGNENSCTDVQANIDTLVGIVTTVIGIGTTASLSTFNENLGISTTNKCARDLGYFVDAFSTDIFTGGNSYTIAFTKFYFNNVGSATTSLLGEEAESNYAFNSARDYAKKAITNQLNYKDLTLTADPVTGFNTSPNSCANVQSAIDTLVSITTQAVGIGNLSTLNTITINPGIFVTGQSKCRRDIGYIVDAIADDLEGYTNKSILEATKSYFTISGAPRSNGLVGEVAESITAFRAIRDYSKKAINNLLNAQNLALQIDPAVNSNQNINGCADVYSTIDNLVGILTTYIGAGSLTGLPSVSLASTVFSANVGASTLPHTYVGGGTVKINTIRPFDGQVVYFGDLYYSVGKVVVSSGGTGYLTNTDIIIEEPETEWGIPATAVAEVVDGGVRNIEMISNGRGYKVPPKVTVLSPDVGINTAIAYAEMVPAYYVINSCTPITSSGICTITISDNVPYAVGVGTQAPFFKQSRLLASGHSLEYIGSGTEISKALPSTGGVAIQDNETVAKNGGLVVFTSTDQSGNFRIGDGVVINQQTGTISGTFYSKSLFSTMTPFILALGG
jgi:hypothetical protein